MESFKTKTTSDATVSMLSVTVPAGHSIEVKSSVCFKQMRPEIYNIFHIISDVYAKHNSHCVITSANDGIHKGYRLFRDGDTDPSKVSKHYLNLAIDVRTRHLPNRDIKYKILTDLREALGTGYLVLYESEGSANEHFHIHFKM